jgi:hypothetical protein
MRVFQSARLSTDSLPFADAQFDLTRASFQYIRSAMIVCPLI